MIEFNYSMKVNAKELFAHTQAMKRVEQSIKDGIDNNALGNVNGEKYPEAQLNSDTA